MQTIVLAGGLGTRLGALGGSLGKPMVEVAGRPFLELLLRQLVRSGLSDFLLCVGHRAARVRDWLADGDRLGIRVRYSEEPSPLGTAGALGRAAPMIEGDTFVVCNGDSMVDFSLAELLDTHRRTDAVVTMTLAPADEVSRFGRITMDQSGRVTSFVEKPERAEPGLVNAGVYICERVVLDRLPRELPASFERQVLPGLVANGLYGYAAVGPLVDIGTPEALSAARHDPALLLRLAGIRGNETC